MLQDGVAAEPTQRSHRVQVWCSACIRMQTCFCASEQMPSEWASYDCCPLALTFTAHTSHSLSTSLSAVSAPVTATQVVCRLTTAPPCSCDALHRWQFRIDLGPRTEPIIDGVRVSIGQASDESTVVASQQSELRCVHQS